jgi:hypothetical protein
MSAVMYQQEQSSGQKTTGFDAWNICTAIKVHFSGSSYDAFKFNFKIGRLTRANFESQKGKYFFDKVSRKYPKRNDLINFFLANYLSDRKWVGSMSDEALVQYEAKMQRIEYTFKTDIAKLKDHCDSIGCSFDDMFQIPENQSMPIIIQMFQNGSISFDTLTVLDIVLNFSKSLNKKVSDPLGVADQIFNTIIGYKPFIINGKYISKEKIKEIVIKCFT